MLGTLPGRWPDASRGVTLVLPERDGATLGLGGPSLVVITGLERPFRTI